MEDFLLYNHLMRLFIAALFPEKTVGELKRLRNLIRSSSDSGSFTPDENLHLTLAFLGECNEEEMKLAVRAVDQLEIDRCPVIISGIGCFSRDDGKLWFAELKRTRELMTLQTALTDNLRKLGIPFDSKKFRPHITLGRRVRGEMKACPVPPVSTSVTGVHLMLSERRDGRMVYTSLFSKEVLQSG